ncbi:hypothetical protein RFI_34963 [Reticulomyxa filosa]|uniref:Uncharacterized protein n=1 Tax=Reticulomyxa filosa TaxID=46433 RepID=X6LKK4_RETFI|nr:hypothetical protein RFI_34963 [Reticulomyxa filosa]|eukprot:ETO02468.1 hypothetical protein RFI_34963 [Reticulomyxa filosa]
MKNLETFTQKTSKNKTPKKSRKKSAVMGEQIGLEQDLAEAARIKEEEKDGKRKTLDSLEEIDAKEKLKRRYLAKDKLVPLFDDPGQSIDNCYIRLALSKKMKMASIERTGKSEEDAKHKERNILDYSLIYGNKMETLKVSDIWKDKKNGLVVHHISICDEQNCVRYYMPNEEMKFTIFEMRMDYLSQVAWE